MSDRADERSFPCEYCGTEGRLYRTRSGHPNDPDTIDAGECPVCNGECSVDAKTFIKSYRGDDDDPMLLEALEIVEAEERAARAKAALQKGVPPSDPPEIDDYIPF